MLSANWFTLAALESGEGQTVVVSQPSEGGFVSAPPSMLFNGQHGTVVAGFGSSDLFPVAGSDLNIDRTWHVLNAGQSVNNFTGNAVSGYVFDSSIPSLTTPLVAVSFDGDHLGRFNGTSASTWETLVLRNNSGQLFLEDDEGGAIPINPLLTHLFEINPSESTQQSLAKATSESEPAGLTRLAALSMPPADEISGEWARAIAFELVADKHDTTEPSFTSGRSPINQLLGQVVGDASDAGLPLEEAGRSRALEAERRAKVQASDDGSKTSQSSQQTLRVDEGNANDLTRRLTQWSKSVGALTAGVLTNHDIARPASGADAAATPGVAAEQISDTAMKDVLTDWDSAGLMALPSVAGDRPWDSWDSMPLLLVLALERISASNSRRGRHGESGEARPTAVSPLRRVPANGTDDAV